MLDHWADLGLGELGHVSVISQALLRITIQNIIMEVADNSADGPGILGFAKQAETRTMPQLARAPDLLRLFLDEWSQPCLL